VASRLGTDVTRRFEPMLAGCPARVVRDEPALHGLYRSSCSNAPDREGVLWLEILEPQAARGSIAYRKARAAGLVLRELPG